MEHGAQRSRADPLGKQMQKQPGQPLVADRVCEMMQRQCKDVHAERTTRLPAQGHRRHGDAATARTVRGKALCPGGLGTDRRQVDLVISAVQRLTVSVRADWQCAQHRGLMITVSSGSLAARRPRVTFKLSRPELDAGRRNVDG
jgi:hypothetical protein